MKATAPTTLEKRDEPTEPIELPTWSKFFSLASKERPVIILAVILMFCAEATGMINPAILAAAYDHLISDTLTKSEIMSEINRVLMTVIIIHFAGVGLLFLRSWILTAASERIVARLRNTLYGAMLKQEIGFFDQHSTGELVSRLGSDTTLIQQAASSAMPEVLVQSIKVIVVLILMFTISPELAGVTIGFVITVLVLAAPFGLTLGKLSTTYQDILGQAQTHSTEALGAMRTVQSFAAEEREKSRYSNKIGNPDDLPWWWPKDRLTTNAVGFYKGGATAGLMSVVFGLGFGTMYFALWYGFKLVNDDKITLGELTAFQSYIFQIGMGLGSSTNNMSQVIEARGASGRVFQLLEREPAIPAKHATTNHQNGQDQTTKNNSNDDDIETATTTKGNNTNTNKPLVPSSMTGKIDFDKVDFAYPSRPDLTVLRNFTLTLQPNTTTALVGSSGAGKSTVVGLLQRFYDVQHGSIAVDGNDIRNLDLQWLRTNIGYVQQEPQLFGLTVRENLCYGATGPVSQQDIDIACQVCMYVCAVVDVVRMDALGIISLSRPTTVVRSLSLSHTHTHT